VRATHQAGHRCAHNADHLSHDTPLSAFFAEVVCTLGATPPRTTTSPPRTAISPPRTVTSPPRTATEPPANGGNCTIRGATRRRHAVARLLMLQNPHHYPNRVRLRHPRAQGPGRGTLSPDHGAATHRPVMQYSQERGKHDQLQYQLSRTNKPKSHHKTNMFCPIILNPRLAPRACAQAQENPGT